MNPTKRDLEIAKAHSFYLPHLSWCGYDVVDATPNRANLRGTDLRGADLHGADLSRANLYRADLSNTDLRGADLHGTDLHGTDLSRANLSGANLSNTDLRGTDLSGADLSNTNLPLSVHKWHIVWYTSGEVTIGCKTKSVGGWDVWFSSSEVYETPRNTAEFMRIEAAYQHAKALYLAWKFENEEIE